MTINASKKKDMMLKKISIYNQRLENTLIILFNNVSKIAKLYFNLIALKSNQSDICCLFLAHLLLNGSHL